MAHKGAMHLVAIGFIPAQRAEGDRDRGASFFPGQEPLEGAAFVDIPDHGLQSGMQRPLSPSREKVSSSKTETQVRMHSGSAHFFYL